MSNNGAGPPDELQVDLDHLTVGEIETIEDLAGVSIDTLAQPGAPKGKAMRALGMVVRQRTDPEFTWEQAGGLKVRFDKEKPVTPTSGGG